jgi:tetratricopeptide (TPR) repeat protein
MDLKNVSDDALWSLRLKIVYFGEHNGKPAGEDELLDIQNEMMARQLVNEQSVNLFALGNDYVRGGNYEKAADCYRRAIRISPRFLDAYTNLGGCLIDSGQLQEAKTVLEEGKAIGVTLDLGNNLDRVDRLLGG